MKKFASLVAIVAVLAVNSGFAQGNNMNKGNMGGGAMQGATTASDDMAWAPAIGGLAVLGVVVGLTAASAASTPPTYSH